MDWLVGVKDKGSFTSSHFWIGHCCAGESFIISEWVVNASGGGEVLDVTGAVGGMQPAWTLPSATPSSSVRGGASDAADGTDDCSAHDANGTFFFVIQFC